MARSSSKVGKGDDQAIAFLDMLMLKTWACRSVLTKSQCT